MKYLRKEELLVVTLTAVAIVFIVVGIYQGFWLLSTVLNVIPEIILAGLVSLILWGFRRRIWKPSEAESVTDSLFRRQNDYKNHSLQLVDEIPRWLDLRNFDECDYNDDGIHFEKAIESYEPFGVPYLGYLKSHLEAAYPDIMELYNKIKKSHPELAKKIRELMCEEYNLSFENIIIDKINRSCPVLNRSKDTGLSQNNMYVGRYVFNILFKVLYNNLQLELLEVKSEGSTYQLEYGHNTIIAQGEEPYMYKLKDVIGELVKDNGLKIIIQNYRELWYNLIHDDNQRNWKTRLTKLRDLVRGGIQLEGDGACKLCPTHPA